MMKVLLLTSYTPHNVYLVNFLTAKKNVTAKIIEKRPLAKTGEEKMNNRKKMIKKYGFLRTINKLLYNKYVSLFVGPKDDQAVGEILFSGESVEYKHDVPTIEVTSINENKSREFIREHEPDIIAVCGTSVIKPEIFQLARHGTINIHCGITPDYRSADPIFWALYNKEPDKVGVTIHYVDEGIDTGEIIYQEAVGVTENDNLSTLYAKCIKTGADLMVRAIDDIENGQVTAVPKRNVPGKAYYHMDLGIWQYFLFQLKFRELKKALRG